MIRTWVCRTHALLFAGQCWHARCSGCGKASAFDFNGEEAIANVVDACRCEW